MREIPTAEGSLILTEAALGAVVGAAALRCSGVAAAPPRGLRDELARLWRERGAEPAGAEVELDVDHCRVAVDIVVVFGARILEVCRAVARAVDEDLRAAVGFPPDHLEVRVVGVRPGPPGRGQGGH